MLKFIEKVLASPITSIILTIAFGGAFFIPTGIKLVIVIALGILLFFTISMYLINFIRVKRFPKTIKSELIYLKIEHDWQITETGDFIGRMVYKVKNIVNQPINIIPFEDARWWTFPKEMTFKCSVVPPDGKFKIIDSQNNVQRDIIPSPTGNISYRISWANKISPPLNKGEEMTFEIKIDTPHTENQSFLAEGAFAGIPTSLPALEATLNFKAPKGYMFKLFDMINVINANGNTNQREINRIDKPKLSLSRTVLTWKLQNLLVKHRYYFKYRFIKEDSDA
jgi:hypothetical protein